MNLRGAGFLLPLSVPAMALGGAFAGGSWNLLTPAFVFGVLPVLDHAFGPDRWNPTADQERMLAQAVWYRVVLFAYSALHFALLAGVAWLAPTLGPMELVGVALATGIATGGIGITVAHELGHKRDRAGRTLAWGLLGSVAYSHFLIEHNRGHHGRVATMDDPASARLGEGFWRFLPRTVAGGLRSAWAFERAPLRRNGVVLGGLLTVFLFAVGAALGGIAALVLLALQAMVAITLLEAVNYVEHYGLERARHSDGGWAPVTPQHSWNASHRLTNWFLFNLQRHSHHHIDHARPYQTLQHLEQSPQLPTGYSGMVLLALVPPVWERVMGPRTRSYRAAHPAAAGGAA